MTTRDHTISLLRFLSFCSIVVCHFFQYYGHPLAWWFNLGVQIFLVISGYLYGQKGIPADPLTFVKKNFAKILRPYWTVITLALVVGTATGLILLHPRHIFEIVFLGNYIPGGEHLWFVSCILLCYLITPLFARLLSAHAKDKRKLVLHVLFFCFIIQALSSSTLVPRFNAAWVNCYLLGFTLGYVLKNQLFHREHLAATFLTLSLGNILQIYLSYGLHWQFSERGQWYYLIWCDYNHVFLGLSLFLVLKILFEHIHFDRHRWLLKLLTLSDKYSYEAYLVHQFFIFSAFSLMALLPAPWNMTLVTFLAIPAATIVLHLLDDLRLTLHINKT